MGDSAQMDFGGLTLIAKAVQIGATSPAQTGTDIATGLTETGTLTAATVTATGTVNGATVASTGAVTGVSGTFTGAVRSSTATVLAASGNAALNPALGSVFTLTPTASQNITAASAPVGAVVYIVVTTSGASSFTQTFTTNFKTTGTLATGTTTAKVFVLCFVGDGTNMNEVSRTTAM